MARHKYLPRNLLKLNERSGLIHDTFPPESTQRLAAFLEDKPRTIYAGKFYNQNPRSVFFTKNWMKIWFYDRKPTFALLEKQSNNVWYLPGV